MFLVSTRNFPPELGGMQNLMEGLSNALTNHGPVKVFADNHENADTYDQNSKLNIERIDTQMDSLLQIWQKLSTDFYEKYKLNQQSADSKSNNYNSINEIGTTANTKSAVGSVENGEQVIDVDYEIIA